MKKLIAILLIIFSLVLTGCNTPEVMTDVSERFVIERHNMDAWSFAAIITDTYTGERFLFVRAGDAGGLVKLEG